MIADLELRVVHAAEAALGTVTALAASDALIVAAVGGARLRVAEDGRRFAPRHAPCAVGALRIAGDRVWVCGDRGELAVSRDACASWQQIETGTRDPLSGLALAADGTLWVAGAGGYAACVRAGWLERVELGTAARLVAVDARGDELAVLGADGVVRRRRGPRELAPLTTGGPARALAATPQGAWLVVGDEGFVARAEGAGPFARVACPVREALVAACALADGRIAIAGARGALLVSGDDGRSWRAASAGEPIEALAASGRGVLLGGARGTVVWLAPAGEAPVAERSDALAGDPQLVLARAPRARWPELAWRWLADAAAHRALLDRSELAALRAALSRPQPPDELARLAAQLPAELDAVLVGGLARGDLAEVLADDSADPAPGWDAIDDALAAVYDDAEPHAHFGTALPFALGGDDPLHGIAVYLRDAPVPHFHFVTYGFTDLFGKETDDPDTSGFGFELTFRLVRAPDERDVPTWALGLLQNLARYVFGTGNRFAPGHKLGLDGPLAPGATTALSAVLFVEEPELPPIASPHGRAEFLQVVGVTDDEYRLTQEWSSAGLAALLGEHLPLLVTDLSRASVLEDPAIAAEVERRVAREGSSEEVAFAGDLAFRHDGGRVRVELGALYAAALPRAMRGRLHHGRDYTLRGRRCMLHLVPGIEPWATFAEDQLELAISPALARELEERFDPARAGTYRFAAWPKLELVVSPTFIRDRDGRAVEARGVTDAALAARLVAAENARDDDPEEHVSDDAPDPERVRRALALSERALALAPGDRAVQATHTALLLDGARAGELRCTGELLALLPRLAPEVAVRAIVRLADVDAVTFARAVEQLAGTGLAALDEDLAADLTRTALQHAPDRMPALVAALPGDALLLAELAFAALQAGQPAHAAALYERLVALPVPAAEAARARHLRALDEACVQAHAARAYDAAVRIAELAQPFAPEHPTIFHSAACAYVAIGDYPRAFAQITLAVEHEYAHVASVEHDPDLGPILDWPEFKALMRDWRARQEGN
jgi:photosystem II stability/assembly factor-like uncharacterized protein/tetratricopeptide (TPR) repeat protein